MSKRALFTPGWYEPIERSYGSDSAIIVICDLPDAATPVSSDRYNARHVSESKTLRELFRDRVVNVRFCC